MGDSNEEKLEKKSQAINIGVELSTLVSENKINKKVADKLENKLKQKNIKITKEQLLLLVDKINNLLNNYSKSDISLNKTDAKIPIQKDENTQKLIQTIDALEKRINSLEEELINPEKNLSDADDKPKMVTTDDIKIPKHMNPPKSSDWNFNPLKEVPNDPESVIILMKWLQHLVDKCGKNNLSTILDYYVDINWISQEAKINLLDYSHGITEEEKNEAQKNVTDLPSKDHIQSFIYIQKLKGKQFDRHFIDRIDGDLSRIIKKLDNYNIK